MLPGPAGEGRGVTLDRAPSDSKLVVWLTLVKQENLGSPPDQGLNDLIYI